LIISTEFALQNKEYNHLINRILRKIYRTIVIKTGEILHLAKRLVICFLSTLCSFKLKPVVFKQNPCIF